MRERLCIAALYADRYARTAAKAVAVSTKTAAQAAQDRKSELACVAGTAVVVGLVARVDGFKAGYELANNRVTI